MRKILLITASSFLFSFGCLPAAFSPIHSAQADDDPTMMDSGSHAKAVAKADDDDWFSDDDDKKENPEDIGGDWNDNGETKKKATTPSHAPVAATPVPVQTRSVNAARSNCDIRGHNHCVHLCNKQNHSKNCLHTRRPIHVNAGCHHRGDGRCHAVSGGSL